MTDMNGRRRRSKRNQNIRLTFSVSFGIDETGHGTGHRDSDNKASSDQLSWGWTKL